MDSPVDGLLFGLGINGRRLIASVLDTYGREVGRELRDTPKARLDSDTLTVAATKVWQ